MATGFIGPRCWPRSMGSRVSLAPAPTGIHPTTLDGDQSVLKSFAQPAQSVAQVAGTGGQAFHTGIPDEIIQVLQDAHLSRSTNFSRRASR